MAAPGWLAAIGKFFGDLVAAIPIIDKWADRWRESRKKKAAERDAKANREAEDEFKRPGGRPKWD